jgi:hypothetical protein
MYRGIQMDSEKMNPYIQIASDFIYFVYHYIEETEFKF